MHESTENEENEEHEEKEVIEPHVHGPDCQHGAPTPEPFRRAEPKLGRNDPCHCGSGLKFKKCHGKP